MLIVPVVDHVRHEEDVHSCGERIFEEISGEETHPVLGSTLTDGRVGRFLAVGQVDHHAFESGVFAGESDQHATGSPTQIGHLAERTEVEGRGQGFPP